MKLLWSVSLRHLLHRCTHVHDASSALCVCVCVCVCVQCQKMVTAGHLPVNLHEAIFMASLQLHIEVSEVI